MFSFLLPKKTMLTTTPNFNKPITNIEFRLGMYNKRASGIKIKQNDINSDSNDINSDSNKSNNKLIQSSGLIVILASITSFCYYFLFRKDSNLKLIGF
jgi:hypothetical protein